MHIEGAGPTGDPAVDEAWAGLGATWSFYEQAYRRNSLDDKGLPLIATVHFGRDYDNAFWNGEQMVFGDGDGVYFNRFTSVVDVIGHELTHGFTQYTSRLGFSGQSGALNESVSDCFGSMVKQMQLRPAGARRGLADRPRAVHRPGQRHRGPVAEGPGHGVQRPGPGQGPAARDDGRVPRGRRGPG